MTIIRAENAEDGLNDLKAIYCAHGDELLLGAPHETCAMGADKHAAAVRRPLRPYEREKRLCVETGTRGARRLYHSELLN